MRGVFSEQLGESHDVYTLVCVCHLVCVLGGSYMHALVCVCVLGGSYMHALLCVLGGSYMHALVCVCVCVCVC